MFSKIEEQFHTKMVKSQNEFFDESSISIVTEKTIRFVYYHRTNVKTEDLDDVDFQFFVSSSEAEQDP